MKHFSFSRRDGQSIVEALVAMSVLMTGMMATIALLTQSFSSERSVENRTTATYLAAEGIEIMKNLIDHDVNVHVNPASASTPGWNYCFTQQGQSGSSWASYELDYTTTDCKTGAGFTHLQRLIKNNPPQQLYRYPSGVGAASSQVFGYTPPSAAIAPTPFTRVVQVKLAGQEIDVKSTVNWSDGLFEDQTITLEDHFYNWNPNSQ